ncbi:hypothetical protein NoPa_00135 [Pseudomonas phage vB_PpuM-NoPa]|uniref:Uncharacterized protein n=1 Tax=Pseudomonas phage vB_PpuM-NoPa TaxID=3132619 RepID=A0AAX4MZJ1_9CAUD
MKHALEVASLLARKGEGEAACIVRGLYDRINKLERELREVKRERHQLQQQVDFMYREAKDW